MKHLLILILCIITSLSATAQTDSSEIRHPSSTTQQPALLTDDPDENAPAEVDEGGGVLQTLKTKFIEGNPAFMTVLTLVLVIGLTISIERLIRLSSTQKADAELCGKLDKLLSSGDYASAKALCTEANTPTAHIASKAFDYTGSGKDNADMLDKALSTEGKRQVALLEKGCSWIALCIRIAPSLGFLGTVIGMVIAFDKIESAGDISPTLVAGGMKVALITTIFGIIIALILQVFYNIVLNKIERLTGNMEQAGTRLQQMLLTIKN